MFRRLRAAPLGPLSVTLVLGVWLLQPRSSAGMRQDPAEQERENQRFVSHAGRLIEAMVELGGPLEARDIERCKQILRGKDQPATARAEKLQEILQGHVFIEVHINPESRVKAARGESKARLRRNVTSTVLIKVLNEGGVTSRLRVSGPELHEDQTSPADCWLEARLYTKAPMADKLSGCRVEYVLMRLRPFEAGKREATLKFDVGQGTQDLGFRAEVPILFTIRD